VRFVVSPQVPSVGFTQRRERGARPLFTRPCRSFWSAFAELIRDRTSPADFCNIQRRASNQTRALDPRRDGGLDLLPFLDMSRPLPCGSGDTRRAAQRPPVRPQCWFFPLARVCPTVMPKRSTHHEDAFGAPCVVSIDVHGSKDRAKDASAERMRRSLVRASGAYALCACATTFPSSASSGHPLSSARLPSREDTRYGPTDRPRLSF
jgi:hypothetical protein